MRNKRAEVGQWIDQIETILIERGVLEANGRLAMNHAGSHFPKELEDVLDGFIENPIELTGLLKICREARDGRPLSAAVLNAAHLMTREILQALQGIDCEDEAAGSSPN